MPKSPAVDVPVSEEPYVEPQSDSLQAPVLPSFAEVYAKLAAPFDKTFQRQIPGGRMLTYITGEQAQSRLTEVLGPNWCWRVDEVKVEQGNVLVRGVIGVTFYIQNYPGGLTVDRAGYGGSQIKLKRDGSILDLGNDVKAAETSAFKRAASKFGVGLYLYERSEAEDELPAQPYGQQGQYTPAAQRSATQFAPAQASEGETVGVIRAINGKGTGLTLQGMEGWFNVSSRTPVDLSQFQKGQMVSIKHGANNFIDAISPAGGAGVPDEAAAF